MQRHVKRIEGRLRELAGCYPMELHRESVQGLTSELEALRLKLTLPNQTLASPLISRPARLW
ncbi:MAG: hypothetical protein ACREV4_12895 [Gammaproteobacteria bacterium]